MGAWEFLGKAETTGFAVSQLEVTNLNLTKDDFIWVQSNIFNNTGARRFYGMSCNNDAFADAKGTAFEVLSGALNSFNLGDHYVGFNDNGAIKIVDTYIKLTENGKIAMLSSSHGGYGGFINIQESVTLGLNTHTTIDTIRVQTTDGASNMSDGSIRVYRLKAKKVADITMDVAANSVTMSNLNIDASKEYILLSDISPSADPGQFVFITTNNYVSSNYWRQQLYINHNARFAARQNNPGIVGTQNKSFIMSRITTARDEKHTFQHQVIQDTNDGFPDLAIQHIVTSTGVSPAGPITSITISGNAGANLGAGSRFMLYEMY